MASEAPLELDKVAPFLIKLFEIVSSPTSDNLVCWSEHGDSFRIVDRTKFAQDVLPLYFKHDNLRSFIRQLNIYGFQRCPNASGRDRTMGFFHPMFTRNGMRNLKDIKRGTQSKKHEQVEQETEEGIADDSEQIQSKRQRADYSIFKTDVARLQKNLEEFEVDLKQHTMQVQQKLAFILSVLDEGGTPGMATALPALGLSEEDLSSPDQPAGDDNSNSTVSEALEAEQLAVEMTS